MWYRRPAQRWLEALPVGNGRLGAMEFGGVVTQRLALNESTFWSGASDAAHDNPAAREQLPEIRKLLFDGEYRKAVELISRHMLGRPGNYGTHLPVGDLLWQMHHAEGEVRDYGRGLDLDQAIAAVGYSIGGVRFTREVIASHADNVIVVRLSADQPGNVSFRMRFQANRDPSQVRVQGNDTLVITADAREQKHSDGKTGVALCGLIRTLAEGGQVTAQGDAIDVCNADAVTVLIALNTTFRSDNRQPRSAMRTATRRRRTAGLWRTSPTSCGRLSTALSTRDARPGALRNDAAAHRSEVGTCARRPGRSRAGRSVLPVWALPAHRRFA